MNSRVLSHATWRATLKYLVERRAMSDADWFTAFEAFDLLRQAQARLGIRGQTFFQIYNDVVENKYADELSWQLISSSGYCRCAPSPSG